ncbi:hypothetical protein D3C85_1656920 [compost metagenome]
MGSTLELQPIRRNPLKPYGDAEHLIREQQEAHENHESAAHFHQQIGIFEDAPGSAEEECQNEEWERKTEAIGSNQREPGPLVTGRKRNDRSQDRANAWRPACREANSQNE